MLGAKGRRASLLASSSLEVGNFDQVRVRILPDGRMTREEAANKYKLNPHRIGDLWLTATKEVVFGHSNEERESLPKSYRSHGSAHELDIPCIIYRFGGVLPHANAIATNVDVCKVLYQA